MAPYPYAAPGPYVDPTQVIGRRIGAFFIDALIVFVLAIVVLAATAERLTLDEALGRGCEVDQVSNDGRTTQLTCGSRFAVAVDDDAFLIDPTPLLAATLVFGFAYFAGLQGLTGATVGKFATGIRVVRQDGHICGPLRAAGRWVVFAVDGPLSLFLCGLITSLVSKGHRRLGDMAAGTFVIAKGYVGYPVTPGAAPGTVAPVGGYAAPPGYQQPPPGYGAPPPTAGSWPTGPAAAPSEGPVTPVPTSATPEQPQWDADLSTWVVRDPATGRIRRWDQPTQRWVSIG